MLACRRLRGAWWWATRSACCGGGAIFAACCGSDSRYTQQAVPHLAACVCCLCRSCSQALWWLAGCAAWHAAVCVQGLPASAALHSGNLGCALPFFLPHRLFEAMESDFLTSRMMSQDRLKGYVVRMRGLPFNSSANDVSA